MTGLTGTGMEEGVSCPTSMVLCVYAIVFTVSKLMSLKALLSEQMFFVELIELLQSGLYPLTFMSSLTTFGWKGCKGERLVLKSMTLSVALDEHRCFVSDRRNRNPLPEVLFFECLRLKHVCELCFNPFLEVYFKHILEPLSLI